MNTETFEPATVDQCEQVVNDLPNLTASGFDTDYASARSSENGLHVSADVIGTPCISITDNELRRGIAVARAFIRANCFRTKTIRRNYWLYGSKALAHTATVWARDVVLRTADAPEVMNGAFIAAAKLECYRIEPHGQNAFFNLLF